MIKVIVSGAAGRMGTRIINVIQETEGITLVGALERHEHPVIGQDVGIGVGVGRLGVKVVGDMTKVIKKADCVIDFSNPDASMKNLEVAVRYDKAMVIGTTGFSSHQRERLRELAQRTRVVAAPNMSIGVNLLLKVISDIASILGNDYDVEIIEAHHRLKKDAPSGTAIRMAEVIAHALGRDLDKVAVYGRKGIIGERKPQEIGMQTIRAGDIVGDHTVLFAGLGERVEITHRVHSRDTFAKGAVRAALWVVNQPRGLYDMQDVLGLKGHA